jgi:hypothetical protein
MPHLVAESVSPTTIGGAGILAGSLRLVNDAVARMPALRYRKKVSR